MRTKKKRKVRNNQDEVSKRRTEEGDRGKIEPGFPHVAGSVRLICPQVISLCL